MSGLSKDEMGFVRARGYGRTSRAELNKLLNVESDEQVYVSSVENGVRTSKPVHGSGEINTKSGDTFSVGPRVTKAAFLANVVRQFQATASTTASTRTEARGEGCGGKTLERLQQEIAALRRAGYGWVDAPEKTPWGWMLRLKGVTLPNGIRTDAMVLVPDNYPLVSPIGFYVRQDAATGTLDASHLFKQNAYHGAVDLSAHGWRWFCGIADGWKPGKHTLVSYINIVFMLFNEKRG